MIVWTCWLKSLKIFSYLRFCAFMLRVVRNFCRGIVALGKYFGLLFVADFVWSYLMGGLVLALQNDASQGTAPLLSNPFLTGFFFMGTALWFFINALFCVVILKQSSEFDAAYYKKGLLNYVQFTLMSSIILFLTLLVLGHFGIVQYPTFPWVAIITAKILGFLTFFYWLTSSLFVYDIFVAAEKAFNFFAYNFPFFGALIIFMYLFNKVTIALLSYFGLVLGSEAPFFMNIGAAQTLFIGAKTDLTILQFMCLKYGRLIVDHFMLSVVFTFYNMRKMARYTDFFFL